MNARGLRDVVHEQVARATRIMARANAAVARARWQRETLTLKRCPCGLSHTYSGWTALPLVGWMDSGPQVLELRNCGCGSTICIVRPRPATGNAK